MAGNNFERMIQMAEEVFNARQDREQLDVNEAVIGELLALHLSSVKQIEDENGPVLWLLLIPTLESIAKKFLKNEIQETELLKLTPKGVSYTVLYLCSVMVLPEYRGKGLAFETTVKAIEEIRKEMRLDALLVWPFSNEGRELAKKISDQTGIELWIKEGH
jgi:GNAT superfamily N-acetyltransferase